MVPQSRLDRKKYCSKKCSYASRALESIWDDRIDFVKENIATLGAKGIAKKYGVTKTTATRKIYEWRLAGIDIPEYKKFPVGTIVMRKSRGQEWPYIKTETTWKRHNPTKVMGVKKSRPVKEPRVKKEKPVKVKKEKKTLIITTKKDVKPRKSRNNRPANWATPPKPEVKHRDITPYNPETHQRVQIGKGIWKEVRRESV